MMNIDNIDLSKITSLGDLFQVFRDKDIPQEQYWYYVNMYQTLKAREKGVPLDGMFELTPFCNLDCKMCYVHLEKENIDRDSVLSVEQWKHIMKQAADAGMIRATLTGGECLIYPGFKELYLFLRSMGIRVSIKTNGVLLNKENIDFFKEYPPDRINISIYGSSNDSYEKVTGYRVFNSILDNLRLLKEAQMPVLICITPSTFLFEDVENIIRLCKEFEFPYIVNHCLFTPRENTGRQLYDLTIPQYVELFQKINYLLGNECNPLEESELPEFGRPSGVEYGIRCAAGKCNFDVNWEGMMMPCINLQSVSENLLQQEFKKVWNNIHKKVCQIPVPSECLCCSYKEVCQSCIAVHEIKDDYTECNRSICEKTRAFVKAGFYKLDS